jgi:hypothetical protein
MKERICLTGLLVGTNHGRISTNPNQCVLHCNAHISVHLQPKSLKLCHRLGRLCLRVFRDSQRELLAHFLKRGENSASYSEVLLTLQDAIFRKRPGQLARGVLLHHDSARPHTAWATQERIQELEWELLEHLPYSPDLAPTDIHLFGLLKNHLASLMANVSLTTKR